MQDQPTPAEILPPIVAFLKGDVLPKLSGRDLFQLRVAINALELIGRELALAPTSDAAELARLTALLGHDGALEALNAELAERIAAGDVTLETPGLAAHLRATAMEKLAVDQPRYAAYQRALEAKP
jgi:hypothetical protein